MRVPLLSFVVVLAVVATGEAAAATTGEEHGGSIKPMSVDEYGPLEKAAKKPKEQILNVQQASPAVPASTYVQKPKYVAYELPDQEKEDSDDSDVPTSSSKKKKKKKKKAAKTDESDQDASLPKKQKKKAKKHKSADDLDSTSAKKHKKEKPIDSEATSSAYLEKEAKPVKKPKKEKKKKKKKEKSGEVDEADAEPVDVSMDGLYLSPSSEKATPDEDDAMPVDVSTTTGQYVSPSKAKSSATWDAYASPKQQQVVSSSSSQPIASGSPDELPPPAAKSSATSDAYAPPKQQQVVSSSSQPVVSGSPDELPPSAKSSATPDAYLPSKQQPMAGDSPDGPAAGTPKLSMGTSLPGIIKKPIAQILSPVIKSVCAKTEYPADCESSIGSIPGVASAAVTDSVGVLKLAMEAVREKVVVAMNAATDRMNAPGVDATTKDALDSCTSSYSDIKTSLDSVDDALKSGDVDTAKTNLDSVETDLTTCDDGFQEHGIPSVMTDHDQELQKLASNLLAIGAAIH